MKHIVLICIVLLFIFCFHFYTTRKIESFKLNVENFDSQCPNFERVRSYVQQYLPEGYNWEEIMKEVEVDTSYSGGGYEEGNNYNECLSTDGWTENCTEGSIDNKEIRTPAKCNKRVDFNCEATDNCKWFYGFCENKNFKQQIEDPFAFRTRNWWQNRIAGYPTMKYNYNRDGFIKIPNNINTIKDDMGENNKNINIYYKSVLSDLMYIINDPRINVTARRQARKYLNILREKMKDTRNMIKKSAKLKNPTSPMFGNKKLCNKNYTRDCFFSNKRNTFIDKMGNVWYREKGDNFVYWDQIVGGANSTDSAGICSKK